MNTLRIVRLRNLQILLLGQGVSYLPPAPSTMTLTAFRSSRDSPLTVTSSFSPQGITVNKFVPTPLQLSHNLSHKFLCPHSHGERFCRLINDFRKKAVHIMSSGKFLGLALQQIRSAVISTIHK